VSAIRETEGSIGSNKRKNPYFLFVDSDCCLDVNYIQKSLNTAEETHVDVVFPSVADVILEATEIDSELLLERNYIDNCSLVRLASLHGERYYMRLNRIKQVDYDLFLRLVGDHGAVPVPCFTTKVNYRVLPSAHHPEESCTIGNDGTHPNFKDQIQSLEKSSTGCLKSKTT